MKVIRHTLWACQSHRVIFRIQDLQGELEKIQGPRFNAQLSTGALCGGFKTARCERQIFFVSFTADASVACFEQGFIATDGELLLSDERQPRSQIHLTAGCVAVEDLLKGRLRGAQAKQQPRYLLCRQ